MDLRAAVLFRPCAFDSQFSEPEPPGSAPAPLVEGTRDVHAADAVNDQDGGANAWVCASVLVWQLQGRVDAARLFGQRLDQL